MGAGGCQAKALNAQIFTDKEHITVLEAIKDEFGMTTTAATTVGLLEAILAAMVSREIGASAKELCLKDFDSGGKTHSWGINEKYLMLLHEKNWHLVGHSPSLDTTTLSQKSYNLTIDRS